MRIDKYLWCVRYFKTRNQASEACKKGHVKINGQPVKPSREAFPADGIRVRKDQVTHSLEVLDLPPGRVGAKLVDLYRKDTTPKEAFAHTEMLKSAQDHYRKKGMGRPTKKERRDLSDFVDDQRE